ncbi:hypothetical protein, partial [Neoaquamicrobium sediminum]|uniref:hypothetical protein n=1 Tax=Neoaquamicrobium sediminum TaxID=1849104 RepID=UPI0040373DB7
VDDVGQKLETSFANSLTELFKRRVGQAVALAGWLQSAPIAIAFVALAPANYSASTGKRRVNPCIESASKRARTHLSCSPSIVPVVPMSELRLASSQ